jgi:S1-C subfamily serine protease
VASVVSPSQVGAPHQAEPTEPTDPPRRHPPRWAWVALVVLLLAVLAVWRYADSGSPPLTRADVDRAVQRGVERSQEQQRSAPPDAVTAYRTITPSLVTVTTQRGAGVALGAGVVINKQGAVLTALHVVKDGSQIQVRFADGTQSSARVVTSKADSDIAVLAVSRLPEVVVPAVLAGVPQVGNAVFAVGNPLGLQGSLSAGVVSATGRSVRSQGSSTLKDLIQFDAAVNPGNSGGPLLNRGGQVVGIVTGLANPSKQSYFVGIGFAVPITTAGGVAGAPLQ